MTEEYHLENGHNLSLSTVLFLISQLLARENLFLGQIRQIATNVLFIERIPLLI
jgi:hypothetical protein